MTMSLDNLEVVDAVGTDKATGEIVLSLLDPWDWEDPGEHLLALQAKINTYLGFVQSGQIYEDYPAAVGKTLQIEVISRFPIPDVAVTFLDHASAVASQLDITITHWVCPDNESAK
jgi:hypothetical protein